MNKIKNTISLIFCTMLFFTANAQKFTSANKFIKKGCGKTQIGKLDNNKDFCYKWLPHDGLDNPNSSNPTVLGLDKTTVYTLMVSDLKGMTTEEKVTVNVYTIEFAIYKPIVFDPLEPKVVDGDSQTLVNIDNDDKDKKFDKDDDFIDKGDDEFVKFEVFINFDEPFSSLPLESGKLKTSGNGVVLWNSNDKKGGKLLNNEFKLVKVSDKQLKASIWFEGIDAHNIQKEFKIENAWLIDKSMTDAEQENCKDVSFKPVSLTVIGVKSMVWKGDKNGFVNDLDYNGDVLDADDPNITGAVKSYRIFPDGRFNSGTSTVDVGSPIAKLAIELSVKPIWEYTLYLRAFDIDDPYNQTFPKESKVDDFVDPNDDYSSTSSSVASGKNLYEDTNKQTYDLDNDNRSEVSMRKAGQIGATVEDLSKDIYSILINGDIKELDFTVSLSPGDNYRVFAYGDLDFLKELRNRDSKDGIDIFDISYLSSKEKDKSILKIDKPYITDILTVWRLLHVESDRLFDFTWHDNQAQIEFTDYEGTSTSKIKKLLGVGNIKDNIICECNGIKDKTDDSAILGEDIVNFGPPPTYTLTPNGYKGNGRFENGIALIGVSDTYEIIPSSLPPIKIEGNGIDYVKLDAASSINGLICTISAPGQPTLSLALSGGNKVKAPTGGWEYKWEFTAPSTGFIPYIGGEILFGQTAKASFSIINADANSITTNAFRINLILRDDDADPMTNVGREEADFSRFNQTLAKAYITPIFDGGGNIVNNNVVNEMILNLPGLNPTKHDDNEQNRKDCLEHIVNIHCQSKSYERDDYWCVYVFRGWQSQDTEDKDTHDNERALNGVTLGIAQDDKIYRGGHSTFIFRETKREATCPIYGEGGTVIHEIGHQFGLAHGDVNKEGLDPILDFGLMGSGSVTNNSCNQPHFVPLHLNFLRSRIKSPGK